MKDTLARVLPPPAFIPRRYKPGGRGAWSNHLAFANDLICAIQPSLIVELGTHYGESYFTFCQSVVENRLTCLCYAIDNWLGDAHAGYYDEDVFEEVSRHNDAHYKHFSYLLRTNFDDAVCQFSDSSIDLLHIDGLHTYQAASHDFRTWLPKVRPGGIILLHDIAVRHDDFGIWRLWNELTAEFAETFVFHHGWGLGVLRKPGSTAARGLLLDQLFGADAEIHDSIRRLYAIYAAYLDSLLAPQTEAPAPPIPSARIQVLRFCEDCSEKLSSLENMEFGTWKKLSFEFPNGLGNTSLRIVLADCPCVIELGEIAVLEEFSNRVLWSAKNPAALRSLVFSGSVKLLPPGGDCVLLSYGNDPSLQIPAIENQNAAARLELLLRLDRSFDPLVSTIDAWERATGSQIEELHRQLDACDAERIRASAELTGLAAERAMRLAMEQSRSWRMTKPLRSLMRMLRTGR